MKYKLGSNEGRIQNRKDELFVAFVYMEEEYDRGVNREQVNECVMGYCFKANKKKYKVMCITVDFRIV